MFDTIEEVIDFYKKNMYDKNHIIYNEFKKNVSNNLIFNYHFTYTQGYGELPFSWNWNLIIKNMGNNFNFLEVGVYKGRILSLIKLLSNIHKKECKIVGVTPLDNIGDKYSNYDNDDYYNAIRNGFYNLKLSMENVSIIKGLSQDTDVLEKLKNMEMFDIIFIDGSHDYEIVCKDIINYIYFLKDGGYLY